MSRVQELAGVAPVADGAVEDLAPVDLESSAARLGAFEELLAELDGAEPFRRPGLALRLNEVLLAMRAPGHEAAEATLVKDALSASRLPDDLVDPSGRACRKEAVETLLACGFPFALEVAPEDLDFARNYRRPVAALRPSEWDRQTRRDRRVAAGVVGVGQAVQALAFLLRGPELQPALGVSAGAGLGMLGLLLWLAKKHPRKVELAGPLTASAFATVVALACAAVLGPTALIGAASMAGAMAIILGRQYAPRADAPRPGDWDYVEPRDFD